MTTDEAVALLRQLHAFRPDAAHRLVREYWTRCPLCKEQLRQRNEA